jgi:hypothetical protein
VSVEIADGGITAFLSCSVIVSVEKSCGLDIA